MPERTNAPRIAPEPPKNDTSGSADWPVLNVPLVEQIITQLIDHPEQHDQQSYGNTTACGTTHCIGGWALAMTPGAEMRWGRRGVSKARLDATHEWRMPGLVAAEILGGDPDYWCGPFGIFYDWGHTDHIIGRLKDLLNEASPAVSS